MRLIRHHLCHKLLKGSKNKSHSPLTLLLKLRFSDGSDCSESSDASS